MNGGSSSIKFSLYTYHDLALQLTGKVERIGTGDAALVYTPNGGEKVKEQLHAHDIKEAASALLQKLEQLAGFNQVVAVAHRIVHGMLHTQPVLIDEPLLQELTQISSFDPDHLPGEIALIEIIRAQHPQLRQVACFDTSFHTTLPEVAHTFALPRHYLDEGIRRYGFHGLSYSYLLQQLAEREGQSVANGRVLLAHLGSGCSMAAVKEGKSIDTTMGFTPVGGLVMGTRPGDLDPGIIDYLLQKKQVTAKTFSALINHQSGLLGVSGTSSDMQDLLNKEQHDEHAAAAVALFCYQAKKWIGALSAVLQGLDTLVFSGGVGENAAVVRARICEGLQYLGIVLDETRNTQNDWLISTADSRVKVYVIPTNEEWMMARITQQLLPEKIA